MAGVPPRRHALGQAPPGGGHRRREIDIAEGLRKALDALDDVVAILRSAETPAAAEEALRDKFGFFNNQAKAIVEMRMRTLTGMEAKGLEDRLRALRAENDSILAELSTPALLDEALIRDMREALLPADARRTRLDTLDLGAEIEDDPEDALVVITESGRIGRRPVEGRTQHRGGKGGRVVKGGKETVRKAFYCSTGDQLIAVSNRGRMFGFRASAVPEVPAGKAGLSMDSLAEGAKRGETVLDVFPTDAASPDLLLLTAKGMCKRIDMIAHIRKAGADRHERGGGRPREGGVSLLQGGQGADSAGQQPRAAAAAGSGAEHGPRRRRDAGVPARPDVPVGGAGVRVRGDGGDGVLERQGQAVSAEGHPGGQALTRAGWRIPPPAARGRCSCARIRATTGRRSRFSRAAAGRSGRSCPTYPCWAEPALGVYAIKLAEGDAVSGAALFVPPDDE